jgi:hypothetical protein
MFARGLLTPFFSAQASQRKFSDFLSLITVVQRTVALAFLQA